MIKKSLLCMAVFSQLMTNSTSVSAESWFSSWFSRPSPTGEDDPQFKPDRDLDNITWGTWKAEGVLIKRESDGSQKLTTNKVGGYQVMEKIALEGNAKTVRIPYNINVAQGNVSIGLLSHDQSHWLGSKSFSVGAHTGFLEIPTENQQTVILVIQNNVSDESSEVTLNKLRILLKK